MELPSSLPLFIVTPQLKINGMTILTKRKQLYPLQYGFGVKCQKDIRGGNIFHSIARYGKPIVSFLYRNIFKPYKEPLKTLGINLAKDVGKRVVDVGVKKAENYLIKRVSPDPVTNQSIRNHSRAITKKAEDIINRLTSPKMSQESQDILKRLTLAESLRGEGTKQGRGLKIIK
jgi:hypothetical protein